MLNPSLVLENITYVLPNGRPLFSSLTDQFHAGSTALVGANGAGKSVLARIMAGELAPTSGHCHRHGKVFYLPQQVSCAPDTTVAMLAGIAATLAALRRIEAGSYDPADFECLGDAWDLPSRLDEALTAAGLDHLEAEMAAAQLSGGEQMRIRLLGAGLCDADFLILDEPSNHLDLAGRRMLLDWLRTWSGGVLVISHDRQMLGQVERIVELEPHGLGHYGGNYDFYLAQKQAEREKAAGRVAHLLDAKKRAARDMIRQQERRQRRQSRAAKKAQDGSQSKLLLNAQKERSEGTGSRLKKRHLTADKQLSGKIHDAVQALDQSVEHALLDVESGGPSGRHLACLEQVRLPFVRPPWQVIDLVLTTGQRLAVTGNNGCGKSILLKLLAGAAQPLEGQCRRSGNFCHLDQTLGRQDPETSVLAQIRQANTVETEGELRTRLALLGFDEQKVLTPCGRLSGGERLKAALACGLYADQSVDCLLLDEPDNHLDLASLAALEDMLRRYRGALVVVSHDRYFLDRLGIAHEVTAGETGWERKLIVSS